MTIPSITRLSMVALAAILCLPTASYGWDLAAETLTFVGETPDKATAKLLQTPEAAPKLRSATQEVTYELGKDFQWKAGSREIQLLSGTRIPFFTDAQLHPAPKSPNSYASCRTGGNWMLYGPGRFFHDHQCVADYTSKEPCPLPDHKQAPAEQLGKTQAKLKAKSALKIVLLGDSISTGADASAISGAPPKQGGFPDLIVADLKQRSGAQVSLKNLSVGGMGAPWGVSQMDKALAEKPDLFIIGFGMNDASGRTKPDVFAASIKQMADKALQALPECEVVVLSSMTANSEWNHSAPELYGPYAKALAGLSGPRIAHADVTSVWTAAESLKKNLDLTGNGLNHPNDFGHRLYAQTIVGVVLGK